MSEQDLSSEQRYCICQKREDELNDQDNNDFMIECDGCNGWFHGKCIGLADRIAGKDVLKFICASVSLYLSIDDMEKYFCAECSNQHGPSICKTSRQDIPEIESVLFFFH